MKYLIMVLCMMFVLSNISAQPKLGLTAGLNLSTMSLKSLGISLDPTTLVGYNAGLISEFKLNDKLFLQPALLFSSKGSKYSVLDEEMSINPGFVELPVNAAFKFGTGTTKYLLNAGPYFAVGLTGKVKSGGESSDIVFGSGESSQMKSFDYGLNFGFGVEINRILLAAHYQLGLANLAPVTSDETKMKSAVIGFSVSYFFTTK